MNNSDETNLALPKSLQKRKTLAKQYVIISAIVIILSILAFYFFYFIKTPIYSLNELRSAIQTKNLVLLEKRANLENIYSTAIDDYVNLTIVETGNSNPLALAMVKFIKPRIVKNLVFETKKAVENGAFAKKKTETKASTTPSTKAPTKEPQQKRTSNPKDYKFNNFKETNITNNIALVSVELINKNTNESVTLNLELTKLEDGSWQLIKISNLKEILRKIDLKIFSSLIK